jgi:hypothetical protein
MLDSAFYRHTTILRLRFRNSQVENMRPKAELSRDDKRFSQFFRSFGTKCNGFIRVIVEYQRGLTAEEIVEEYHHINLAQVYAALAYYHANRDEIDRELETETADSSAR